MSFIPEQKNHLFHRIEIEDTSLEVKNYFCILIEVLRGLVKYDVTATVSFTVTSFYHLLTIASP